MISFFFTDIYFTNVSWKLRKLNIKKKIQGQFVLCGLLFALARFLCNESLIDGKTVQLHICEEHACILWDEQQRWGCSRFSEPTPHWPLQPDHRSSKSAASSGFKDQKRESIATAKWAVLQWGDSATILQWDQPAYMFITKVVLQRDYCCEAQWWRAIYQTQIWRAWL